MTADPAVNESPEPAAVDTAVPAVDSNRIVVGVDGSDSSKEALRWAARLAGPIGATVTAVVAWQVPSSYGYAYMPDGWRPDGDAEKVLSETIDSVFGADRPADLQLLVKEGNAAQILVEESAHAQMIIVGSRGHGGFVGLLLGSVSASAAEHAQCPVLVVH
jgi:nucleotide-binding universal stress UspA family protein